MCFQILKLLEKRIYLYLSKSCKIHYIKELTKKIYYFGINMFVKPSDIVTEYTSYLLYLIFLLATFHIHK